VSLSFIGWGANFLGWGTESGAVAEPSAQGAGRRLMIRPDMALAARRLADDLDAFLLINVILAAGVLEQ
jgi:hypothetical protein